MKSLKQLKEERAMTYQQISDRSGVPVSTIHRVIDGQAKNPGAVYSIVSTSAII